jgi:leader peptidase (prepilin peptidase)/N-methyltransferase
MLFIAELPPTFFAVAAFIFGLLIGSFLNVVIYRVPRGQSIIRPGSRCGACGEPVKPYDNIPLLSYVLLRGHCRACKTKISWIYPAVEFLAGLLFLLVVLKNGPTWAAIGEMIFVAVIIPLIFIDARHWLLPNTVTYPAFALALVASTLSTYSGGTQAVTYPAFALVQVAFAATPEAAGATFMSGLLDSSAEGLSGWQVVVAGLIFLSPAIIFWVIDLVDYTLFNKYFDQPDPEGTPEDVRSEAELERQQSAAVITAVGIGLAAIFTWIAVGYFSSGHGSFVYQAVRTGLIRACIGALVGGGLVWILRALWFYLRGVQGMAMGDVRMMIVVSAFLGWQSALLVLFAGSLLGSIIGLIYYMRRSSQGLQTGFPFGVSLGIAAIAALFVGEPVLRWYTVIMR